VSITGLYLMVAQRDEYTDRTRSVGR